MADLETIKQELMEAVGGEWVEDDPAVLTCYFRDVSTIDSPRANFVVLPASTEEVQRLMLIARRHKVPLVPLSTGFNIAGLTLPRQKGIVVDLKRMDKILEVDPEAMTMTMQPYVRNAAAYAEANRYFVYDDLKLRISNPITVGSASFFGNIMSGGMSVNALSTGAHHDNIAGQTWVLPDGQILRFRSSINPLTGNLGAVRGPGPDVSGMFYNAEGQFGICTEMVFNLFPDPKMSRMLFLRPKNMIKYSFADIVEFLYELSQEDFVSEVYKSGNITMAAFMGDVVESVARTIPDDGLVVTITAHCPEEMEIKQRKVEQLMRRHKFAYYEDAPLNMFFTIMGTSREEFADNVFKKCYRLGGIMRWQGAFYFVGCATTLDRITELKQSFEGLIARHFEPMGPPNTLKNRIMGLNILGQMFYQKLKEETPPEKLTGELLKLVPGLLKGGAFLRSSLSKKKWDRHLYPAHTAIQGPLTLGRACWFELDMWYNPGDRQNREQIRKFSEDCTKMMLDLDLFIPRDFANAFAQQFPILGTYRDLVIDLKRLMDPDEIMNPKVMNLDRGAK